MDLWGKLFVKKITVFFKDNNSPNRCLAHFHLNLPHLLNLCLSSKSVC